MRSSIRKLLVFILMGLCSTVSFAEDSRLSDPLYFKADYSVFRYPQDLSRSYVEIFYNLQRSQLKYSPDSLGYVALVDFKITLKDTSGAQIDTLSWTAGSRISLLAELEDSGYLISDIFADLFPPGNFIVELEVKSGSRTGFGSFPVEIISFESTDLQLSSPMLAYEITKDDPGKFSKNGYKVMPNPSGRFSQNSNVIYMYIEAYNLDISPDSDSLYSVSLDILDIEGKEIKSIPPSKYRKPGDSAVVVTGFSIAALKAGMYRVRANLTDGSQTSSAEKVFTVIASQERVKEEMMRALLKIFPRANSITNKEEAQQFRDDITYIATIDELRLYDSLNLDGKANFQKQFWAGRDPDPTTAVNELQLEHYRRLKFVVDNFDQYKGVIQGWKSDPGRVYILYGEPTEIEKYPSSIESRTWQRWWYHGIEGGVYFIFVDFEETGNLVLVHSSKQDEVKDYNWEDKVKMTVFQR